VPDVARVYWALTLDHHAVTLSTVAPYDTIRLTATPRTVNGTALDSLPAPTFTSLDLDRAQVSANGLVRVIKSGKKIPVIATLTVGNLQHADTAFINASVVASPPELATLSIKPDPGDSAKTAANIPRAIAARAVATDGVSITGLSVYYQSLDPHVATVDRASGFLTPVRPGHVKLVATATAYGITKSDTLQYTIGYTLGGSIFIIAQRNAIGQMVSVFWPQHIIVAPGSVVIFQNDTQDSTDVTFEDPASVASADDYCAPFASMYPFMCGSGNIGAFTRDPDDEMGGSAVRVRRFPVPGIYAYRSTIFGTTGIIEVVDEPAAIP
jgi:hypothetical protein